MATISKTGFGWWKKTVVEHAGKTEVYKGNAKVEYKEGSVCVTESSLLSQNSTCYIEKKDSSQTSSLPDGTLVGKSKSIKIAKNSGGSMVYDSGIFGVNSMEKSGDTVSIVRNGIFGKRVVDTFKADDIARIESEDCNVCKAVNPVYK